MEKVIENCDMESLRDIISFIKIVEIPFDGKAETGEKREETWPPHVTKKSIFIIRKKGEDEKREDFSEAIDTSAVVLLLLRKRTLTSATSKQKIK